MIYITPTAVDARDDIDCTSNATHIYISPLDMIYISPLSSCTSIFKIQVDSYAQVLMDMRHVVDAMQDMMQCKTYDR